MLLSYLCVIFTCGIALAQYERVHTPAERMRLLGPLASDTARSVFNCPALIPSPTVPTSVHALRPADIKHIASMGDSLTAANGAKAFSIVAVLVEYRGVSWSIGGDENLKTVITLANILRQFNSKLDGYSQGTGPRNSSKAGFNVAKAGGVSSEMPSQANLLVDRMVKALGPAKYAADWKLVTFFIGGNDLCGYCKDTDRFSAATYTNNIKTALDILKARMPRTLVNFVTVLNVAELEDLHEGIRCQSLQNLMCDCGVNKKTREQVRTASFEYQKSTTALIDSGVYDTSDDFTVVRQPFMEQMTVPSTSDGLADFSYFSPDCFHFSQKGHEAAAIELWNNMMQKVGQKTTLWNMLDTLTCPSEGNGYIYTSKNSA
jgi:phospholipase B1